MFLNNRDFWLHINVSSVLIIVSKLAWQWGSSKPFWFCVYCITTITGSLEDTHIPRICFVMGLNRMHRGYGTTVCRIHLPTLFPLRKDCCHWQCFRVPPADLQDQDYWLINWDITVMDLLKNRDSRVPMLVMYSIYFPSHICIHLSLYLNPT